MRSTAAASPDLFDDGELLFDLAQPDEHWRGYDAVLCRSVSQSRGLAALHVLEHWGMLTYNAASVTETCNDKLLTTLALLRAASKSLRSNLEPVILSMKILSHCCHLSVKIDRFSDNLPSCQAPLEDELSHMIWRGIGSSSFSFPISLRASNLSALAPRYLEDAPTNAAKWSHYDRF